MSTRNLLVSEADTYASTKRYYDEHADSYAEATLPISMERTLGPFVDSLQLGDRVVDLGCGAGRDLSVLTSRGLNGVGLDASYPLARLARLNSGCSVVVGDLRSLPFSDESFSGAWASASLLHLRRNDVQAALREAVRVLQMGGYLFTSVKCGARDGLDREGRWFSYFEPSDWLSRLQRAGLSIIGSDITWKVKDTLDNGLSVDWINCLARKL